MEARHSGDALGPGTAPGHGRVGLTALAFVAVAALTALPIVRLVVFLATTGADVPSADDWVYAPLIDRVLAGEYDWRHFFGDTFYNTHATALPALLYLALARFFDYSVYAAIYLGIGLAIAKLWLLADAITLQTRSRARWLVWPVLAALLFSASQVSVLEFGNFMLQLGLHQLGFFLGIWGLVRHAGRWPGVWWMAFGGVVACLSWGAGPMVWPVYLLGLVLLGYRRRAQYAAWLAASVLGCWPYVQYLVLEPRATAWSAVRGFGEGRLFVRLLGWPFLDTMSPDAPLDQGRLALGLVAVGIGLLAHGWHRRRIAAAGVAVSLMLILYSLLVAWQVSLFRGQAAPWYGIPMMPLWIGLLVLVYRICLPEGNVPGDNAPGSGQTREPDRPLSPDQLPDRPRSRPRLPVPLRSVTLTQVLIAAWGLAVLGSMIFLYTTTNLDLAAKSFFLVTRTPAAASCVRNYHTAPTYCERTVFGRQPPGLELVHLPTLARPLERHELSVFARRQEWTMQGDVILGQVDLNGEVDSNGQADSSGPVDLSFYDVGLMTQLKPTAGTVTGEPYWSADQGASREHWSSYRRLDLVLPAPSAATWTVVLPAGLEAATLRSAVAPAAGDDETGGGSGLGRGGVGDDDSGGDGGGGNSGGRGENGPSGDGGGTRDARRGGVRFAIHVGVAGEPERLVFQRELNLGQRGWQPLSVPLDGYAGTTITLRLSMVDLGGTPPGDGVFRYPRIELALAERRAAGTDDDQPPSLIPRNTDLAPGFPRTTALDARFDVTDLDAWWLSRDIGPLATEGGVLAARIVGVDPILDYEPKLDLCLADYAYFHIKLAAAPDIAERATQVFYKLDGDTDFSEARAFHIPLLADGDLHAYSYDVRLLEPRRGTRLTGLRLDPIGSGGPSGRGEVRIADFRLVRRAGPSHCRNVTESQPSTIIPTNENDKLGPT